MTPSTRPTYTLKQAESVAVELYGVDSRAKELPGERDQNFRLTGDAGTLYVLKISHLGESAEALDFQNQAMARLSGKHFPSVITTISGDQVARIADGRGRHHYVRLLTWLRGTPVSQVSNIEGPVLHAIGRAIGRMDSTLLKFEHPAMQRDLQWDPMKALEVIGASAAAIRSPERRRLLDRHLTKFEANTGSRLDRLRRSVVHTDLNENNLLIGRSGLTGIIDFGDLMYTWTVSNLSHACAYLMLGSEKPFDVAAQVAHGYRSQFPLTDEELYLVPEFIRLRLSLSVSISANYRRQQPNDPYLTISEQGAWELLLLLDESDRDIDILRWQLRSGTPR